MDAKTSYFFYWLLMLTLYGMDCKSFQILFLGEETAEKRTEKRATERVFLPPCNPPAAPFYYRTNFL
jgi:hypothetical protein